MWHLQLVLVSWCCCSGVIHAAVSVLEGESVTIDCGFQTTVNGGNLLWQVASNGGEIPLGYIVPGDHFCGIDTVECIVHTNGSITLFNVTLSDGEKYYRCLRGDKEGYHYFSNVSLTVVSKESLGHPVIQPPTESKANAFISKDKGVFHAYEQPTCEDKEDGALVVTCYPPSGLIVDKVYHQVHCNCTDSDGNSNSLNITVNSHASLKENNAAIITLSVIIAIIVVSEVIWCICVRCKIKNARNSENVSWRTRLAGSGMPKEINDLQEMNQRKDRIIFYLIHKLTEIDDSLYLHHRMSHLDIPWTGISAYSHHRDRYFYKVGASRNCKESDLDELLSDLSKHFRDLLLCHAYEDHHMKVGENPESSDKITFKRGEVELSHPSV